MTELALPGIQDVILLCTGIATVYLAAMVRQLVLLKRPRRRLADVKEPMISNPQPAGHGVPNSAETLRANQLALNSFSVELKRMNIEIAQLRTVLQPSAQARDRPAPVPFYNEAMAYARRGLTAAGIASRCRISLGEAELVIALVQNPESSARQNDNISPDPELKEGDDRQQRRTAA